jgi:hypothetical protein
MSANMYQLVVRIERGSWGFVWLGMCGLFVANTIRHMRGP